MINVELFPCSGGMAEGFRRAGVAFDFAFDYSADACDSYEMNLGHRPVQIDVHDLLRMARAGWSPGPIDLLVADPPCTPWSRAGKRQGTDDERDMLETTIALIEILRPRAYLIGNVPGLDDAPNWHVVQRVLGGLARAGYCVADYRALDAASYGVPQHRVRPFWYGHLDGPCLRWPEPTHGDVARAQQLPGVSALLPWVTCADALAHLSAEDLGRPVRLRRRGTSNLSDGNHEPSAKHPASVADRPSKTIASSRPLNGAALLVNPKHPTNTLSAPANVITQSENGARVLALDPDSPNHRPSCSSEPATVVYEDGRIAPPGHHAGANLSQPDAVVLSELAAKILQGFPETWRFAGRTKAARWAQLGQAMPPALAEAVARSIVAARSLVRGAA